MPTSTFIEKFGPAAILLGIFFGFFFQLGSVPLFDLDEGAFSEATREMILSGNYLTTYLNGELRFDKPILIYWFQAASVHLFGLNEFALRLPSALAATLWAGVLYLFTKRFFGIKTAVTATFMMTTALQISIISKAAIADALLNLFIAASMFGIYLYYATRDKRYLYGVFVLIGLGALTKGPVAVMIPLAVSFIFFALKRELGFWLKTVFNPVGLLLFLLVAGPWYVLEYLDQGQKFLDGFFFKHNLSRFNTSFEGHSGSLFYYVPVLLIGLLPFTSVLFTSLRNIKTWFGDDMHKFFAIWFLFVFIFFSFSGTKLPHYVIYGYTPLFVIMALNIDKMRSDRLLLLPLALLFAFLLFLPEIATLIKPLVKDRFAQLVIESAPAEFGTFYRLYFAASLAILLAMMFAPKMQRVNKLVVLGLLSVIGINGFVIPTYAKIAQQPVKEAALLAKERNLDVNMWKLNMPSFIVYSEKLVAKTTPQAGEIVITKKTNLDDFNATEIIYEKHGIVLAKIIKTEARP